MLFKTYLTQKTTRNEDSENKFTNNLFINTSNLEYEGNKKISEDNNNIYNRKNIIDIQEEKENSKVSLYEEKKEIKNKKKKKLNKEQRKNIENNLDKFFNEKEDKKKDINIYNKKDNNNILRNNENDSNKKENIDSKKEVEWDSTLFPIIESVIKLFENYKHFSEDFSYYIYNDFRGLKVVNGLKNSIKDNFSKNELILNEFYKIIFKINNIFNILIKKYGIKISENYPNIYDFEQNLNISKSNNLNSTIKNEIKTNDSDYIQNNSNTKINGLNEKHKFELFATGLIHNSLLKSQNEKGMLFSEDTKFEVQNFNLSEENMIAVISGIKFNSNIIEINLSGNILNLKSCYWLGTIFKTNPNIKVLDIQRCNLNNDCLYMLIEGTKYDNENLNKEQFQLEKLILKDNPRITDISNNEHEHPLCLILKKFKLKWLNMTNLKLQNSGLIKFFKSYINLSQQNKIYMENLILINNNFGNEECLSLLGDILELPNCALETLVISKNFITAKNDKNSINYFEKFMKSLSKNKSLKEIFMISCGIGKNEEDIDILYNMLCENKNLDSIRLFGNDINKYESFKKILGIFSEYKNDLKNNHLKSLDLSKNGCNIKIDDDFLNLIEKLKLEYLDINQNNMQSDEKEIFKEKTNKLENIKIIY